MAGLLGVVGAAPGLSTRAEVDLGIVSYPTATPEISVIPLR